MILELWSLDENILKLAVEFSGPYPMHPNVHMYTEFDRILKNVGLSMTDVGTKSLFGSTITIIITAKSTFNADEEKTNMIRKELILMGVTSSKLRNGSLRWTIKILLTLLAL